MAQNTNNQNQQRNQPKKGQESVRYGSSKNLNEDDDIGNKDLTENRSRETMDDDDVQDDDAGDRS